MLYLIRSNSALAFRQRSWIVQSKGEGLWVMIYDSRCRLLCSSLL